MSVIKFITSSLFGLCTTIDGCFFCPHRVTGAHTPSSQHRLRCQTLWLTSGPWFTRREYLLLSCCQSAARQIRCLNYCACFMLWKAQIENTMHHSCYIQYIPCRFVFSLPGLCVLGWRQENVWGLWGGVSKHRQLPDLHHPQHADSSCQGNTTVTGSVTVCSVFIYISISLWSQPATATS